MSGFKKKTPAEELIESLLQDVGEDTEVESSKEGSSEEEQGFSFDNEKTEIDSSSSEEDVEVDEATIQEFLGGVQKGTNFGILIPNEKTDLISQTQNLKNSTNVKEKNVLPNKKGDASEIFQLNDEELPNIPSSMGGLGKIKNAAAADIFPVSDSMVTRRIEIPKIDIKTDVLKLDIPDRPEEIFGDNEKTVAVAGYQVRSDDNYEDKVKVSVGQNRSSSSGYAVWGAVGSNESNLAQADNLRIAQEKILELETENEKLRLQNEELMSASEIIKERSDLLSAQLSEYKNDRDSLEDSFKNEVVLLKNHLAKKDNELQKAVLKTDELDSRLKFDMKKIRVRERELENRLELIRAEKNAIVKNKDEQILDLRRKMDVLQMEVDSYRQKCVELNKSIETNQESFKRTTRALRLAMANLELQEENKVPMKKAE
jgi:hypothetical protein